MRGVRSRRGGSSTTSSARTAVWDTARRKSLRRRMQQASTRLSERQGTQTEGVTKASKKDRGGRWVPPKYFSLRCGSLERCSLRQLEHLGADGLLVHSAFVSGCKPTSPS